MAKTPKPKKPKVFDLKKFLEKELRRAFRRSPMYTDALKRAKFHIPVGNYQNGKEKTLVHYQCNECKKFFLNKNKDDKVAVDHIKPIVSVEDSDVPFEQWLVSYAPSLYCSMDNLQVLCNWPMKEDGTRSCHGLKTKLENEERKKHKDLKKGK